MPGEPSEAGSDQVVYVSDEDPYYHQDVVCPSRVGGLYLMARESRLKGTSYQRCGDCFRDG